MVIALGFSQVLQAQDEKPELLVALRYFNQNGSFQYLKVKTMVKENNKLQPLTAASLQLYLDEAVTENLIGKITTDEKGEGKAIIPPSLKEKEHETPLLTSQILPIQFSACAL